MLRACQIVRREEPTHSSSSQGLVSFCCTEPFAVQAHHVVATFCVYLQAVPSKVFLWPVGVSCHVHPPAPPITTCWTRETLGSASSVAFASRGRLQPRGRRLVQVSLSPSAPCLDSSPCRRRGMSVCLLVTWPARASRGVACSRDS